MKVAEGNREVISGQLWGAPHVSGGRVEIYGGGNVRQGGKTRKFFLKYKVTVIIIYKCDKYMIFDIFDINMINI